MKTIFIIGFMGSGKTTIGKFLNKQLGIQVFDMDVEIEKAEGKSISKIFEDEGEGYFRTIESSMLKELTLENVIITTGGGVVLSPENREWLKQQGTVIYLQVSAEEIIKRLAGDQTRPLLKKLNLEKVQQLLGSRLPLYQELADITIDTTLKSVDSILSELTKRLNN